MVRVHCSKDTLDAHARSDVVLRSRKVVKSITAHIGDRAIRNGLAQAAPLAVGLLRSASLAGEQAGHGRVEICLQLHGRGVEKE